jgi:glycoside/pentoside/hexuronide:cation symporter, GPH family
MAVAIPALQEEKVPLKSRIWVSAGDASCAFLQTIIGGGALTYYYTRVMNLQPDLAGWAWIIFGIWNSVNDPLLGYIADRTRSKIGRRRPYIRYGAPIFALSFILLFLGIPGSLNVQWALFVQLLLGLFLYDTLYTAIATSLYLMPYEMAISNKARSSVFIWKIIFSVFSMALPPVLLLKIQPGPGDDPTPFRWIMVVLGIGLGTIIFASTYFYEEKHYQQDEEQPGFIKSIVESFKNLPFIVFLVSSFTVIYASTGLIQGIYYYFDELKIPQIPVFGGLLLGIVGGIFLWVNLRERIGLKRCLMAWLAIFALGCYLMLPLGYFVWGAAISFVLIGIGFAGGLYLIPLMNGDVIDFDEKLTGLRREGMYAGINSFVTKPAISLAQTAFLIIVGWFGYNQTLAKGLQPESAHTGIILGWMLVPAILLTLSLVSMIWYPLAGASWEKTKKELAEVHAAKEKAYLESLGYKTN